jgi:hypothetical protein
MLASAFLLARSIITDAILFAVIIDIAIHAAAIPRIIFLIGVIFIYAHSIPISHLVHIIIN